ncbi:MAG TPA: YaeQ family protein [Polyangiaceae bacterium]|nr:YaeQ family protein [Polyangiaceae bacterium]
MAQSATPYHFKVTLSDVDRGVYEALDLRPARHPSESLRYLLLRTLAYSLSYEPGIAFSKGGLSSVDEPPLNITDASGVLRAWIEVGSPSAERLHKASKAAERVLLYSAAELQNLKQAASSRPIHRLDAIEVYRLEPSFLDRLEPEIQRTTTFELVRSSGVLYVTLWGKVHEATLENCRLTP